MIPQIDNPWRTSRTSINWNERNQTSQVDKNIKKYRVRQSLTDFSMLLQATGSELESPYLEKGEDSKGRDLSIKTFHLCFHRSS